MRIRRVDAAGDMQFGHSQFEYWFNAPEGVGLLVMERLMLFQGEWFADTADGTAWATQVLGERTRSTRDLIVRDRAATTTGVTEIMRYASRFDPNTREWAAAMVLDTVYGAVAISAPRLPGAVPVLPPQAAVAGPGQAAALGVLGGSPISMTPADLTVEGPATVTDFVIQRLEAGQY